MHQGHSLVLLADMKAPGEAVLIIRLADNAPGCELMIIGRFLPKGLAGLAYWHGLHPFHAWLYKGMLREMARRSEARIVSGPEEFTPSQEQMCLLPE